MFCVTTAILGLAPSLDTADPEQQKNEPILLEPGWIASSTLAYRMFKLVSCSLNSPYQITPLHNFPLSWQEEPYN